MWIHKLTVFNGGRRGYRAHSSLMTRDLQSRPAPYGITRPYKLDITHFFTFYINNFNYVTYDKSFILFSPYFFSFPKRIWIYNLTYADTIDSSSRGPTTITSSLVTPVGEFFVFHKYLLSFGGDGRIRTYEPDKDCRVSSAVPSTTRPRLHIIKCKDWNNQLNKGFDWGTVWKW